MTNFNTVPIEDLYESTLQSDLGSTDMVAKTVKIITGTLTGGKTTYMGINYDRPSKYELVEISAINGQDVTILNRALPTKSGGTGTAQNHPAGSKVIITHNYKVFQDIATAFESKADGTPTLDGSGAVYVDGTARDAAVTSPQNGQIVTTAGVLQYYSGGTWNDLDVGTPTPNASTTVAGKVEIATQTQLNAGTDTGETGAQLVGVPSNLAITAQQNKYTYAGTTAGSSTVYTATVTPAPAAYVEGQGFTVLMDETNGASPTINFNGLGAKSIVDASGVAIAAGILPSGALVDLKYNGTSFQVMNVTYKFNIQTFTSSGTWTKPAGCTLVLARVWGAGGSGAKGTTTGAGGGGGGGYAEQWFQASQLADTITVTVGAGGASQTTPGGAGNTGGLSSFGTGLIVYGGGPGQADGQASGGGGGSISGPGLIGAGGAAGGNGGGSLSTAGAGGVADSNGNSGLLRDIGGGGGGGTSAGSAGAGGNSINGGGGGGGGVTDTSGSGQGAGGSSIFGGGGGGGCATTSGGGTGGASVYGGAGGAGSVSGAGVAGSQPGGGGGASRNGNNSGAGGAGQVIVISI